MRYLIALLLALPLFADPDWEAAMKSVRDEMGDGVRVEHVGLFVVATDADDRTYQRAKGSLTGCADALLKTYFDTRPTWVLTCYLFKGAETYNAYVKQRSGHDPTSPYGFYQHDGKCLIMDISTGTGTLVHEMVHAFAEADFPSIPSWFNEGMGSLHEQCDLGADGSLEGLTNWRLPILQKALAADTAPSWEKLSHLSTEEFYGEEKGVNYSVARYLCVWLQQQKLLVKFYKEFRAHAADDPTGWATLVKTLGRPEEECEREWRVWAGKLEWKR